jgi:hypothetical protein
VAIREETLEDRHLLNIYHNTSSQEYIALTGRFQEETKGEVWTRLHIINLLATLSGFPMTSSIGRLAYSLWERYIERICSSNSLIIPSLALSPLTLRPFTPQQHERNARDFIDSVHTDAIQMLMLLGALEDNLQT